MKGQSGDADINFSGSTSGDKAADSEGIKNLTDAVLALELAELRLKKLLKSLGYIEPP